MQNPSIAGPFLIISMLLTSIACSSPGSGNLFKAGADENPVVATVDGDPIRLVALDDWLMEEWFDGQSGDDIALYQMRREGLERMIGMQILDALADDEGITVPELVARKIDELGPVDEEEVRDFYDDNRERIRSDKSFEELEPQIREYVEEERPRLAVALLQQQSEVQVFLATPRLAVEPDGPSRGPEDARVTIVEFSDYQCPFCQRAEPNVEEVLALYPDDVRLVYRHLPLSMHPEAMGAARAAVCAERMGRFWDYHALLFENQKELGDTQLIALAAQLGIEPEPFEACLADPETQAKVDRDIAAAAAAGATATPTFYINGIQLRGAKDADSFKVIIDRELE